MFTSLRPMSPITRLWRYEDSRRHLATLPRRLTACFPQNAAKAASEITGGKLDYLIHTAARVDMRTFFSSLQQL